MPELVAFGINTIIKQKDTDQKTEPDFVTKICPRCRTKQNIYINDVQRCQNNFCMSKIKFQPYSDYAVLVK